MQNRTVDPNARRYAQVAQGPMDEDDAPRAALVLAALTDGVPVGTVERPWARAGNVILRAMVLIALALLAYLPAMFASNLLDGEADAFHRQPFPRWDDWGLSTPATPIRNLVGTPPLLRVLLRQEAFVIVLRFFHVYHVQGGDGPLGFHIGGAALHAAVTAMLWLILRRLNRPGGWLAAALFAVNPGSAAAVEWIGSRGRLYGALFALTGCWLLLRGVGVPRAVNIEAAEYDPDEDPRGIWKHLPLVINIALAFLGMLVLGAGVMCQPTVAVVALVTLLLVAWRRGLGPWDLTWIAPLAMLTLACLVLTVKVSGTPAQDPDVAALGVGMRALWWIGRSLQRIGWPLSSADLASAGGHGQIVSTCGLGGAAIVAVLALVPLWRKIGGGPAVAGLCFLLLVPTVFAPPAIRAVPGLSATRQAMAAATYLVSIPVLALLADLIIAAAQWVRVDLTRRMVEVSVAAAAIVLLACAGAVRAHAFVDTETILKTAVRVNGRSWDDRSRLAGWYLAQKRPDPALEVMAGLTMENCPDATTAITQGDLLVADGDANGAMAWYQHAGELAPDSPEPIDRASSTLVAMGRIGDAFDNYERAFKRHPESAQLHFGFGNLVRRLNEEKQVPDQTRENNRALAEEQFRRAIAIDPDVADYHVALSTVLADQANPDDPNANRELIDKQLTAAALELQEAVRLDPDNFDAFHNAGIILLRLHADDKAVRMLVQAAGIRPDSAMAKSDLAVAQIMLARNPKVTDAAMAMRLLRLAKSELEEALRLQPELEAAKSNLRYVENQIAIRQRRSSIEGK